MIPRRLNKGDKFGALLDLWNQLIDHLHSMRVVPGKGICISQRSSGIIISATTSSRGTTAFGSSNAHGSFIVSQSEGNNGKTLLEISAGFVCVNGKTFVVKKQQVVAQAGLLCVTIKMNSETGDFLDPVLEYGEFDAWHYPIAQITQSGNGIFDILQYPVTVATFILTKMCIFAKAASNGK